MKNVLISGGTRGLGLAMVRRLVSDGYHVIATGRCMSDPLQSLIDGPALIGRISFVALDLSESRQIHDVVRRTTDEHGHLFGLVNNAALGFDGILATMHDSQIEELLRVNVLGAILLAKYASRSMLLRREGRIVNIASIIGHTGFSGLSVYGATKSAMLGFSRSLARELGNAGITVNSVSPGYMHTDMTSSIEAEKLDTIMRRSPLKRLADVSEVADGVAFLLSEKARSITGTDLVVDAGSIA